MNPFKYIVSNEHFVYSEERSSQRLFRFPNGFGASVVKHKNSYGGRQGLYELAVLEWSSESHRNITYRTPITNDVLGWLTEVDVLRNLVKIHDLTPIPTEEEEEEGEVDYE